jgi:radical SAM family uncharacterized protein
MSPKKRETAPGLPGAEKGTIRKHWRGKVSVALAYPNAYHVGMSSLGFQAVYGLFNSFKDVVCERVFLSQPGKKTEGLRSLESNRPPADFDIIAFSISFENDYPNLLTMLDRAGLPLHASERPPSIPLIIAGGVTSLLNPEPLAPFVDCFLIGEAESLLPGFFEVYFEIRAKTSEKQSFLRVLASTVSGVYVPSLYDVSYAADATIERFSPKGNAPSKITRAVVDDLSHHDTCTTVLTAQTAFDNTYLIEAARGCPHGCRFCAAGYVYRPPRFRKGSQLAASLEKAVAEVSRIGVVAADVGDIPDLESFCCGVLDRHISFSFSSLRADLITPTLLALLKQSGAKTVTIAPDAGSEAMRRTINKGISEQDVFRAVEMIGDAGIPNLKLYFMVGLPTETASDVDGIISLCKEIKQCFLKAGRAKARLGRISVSLNAFIPKPFTPFQWVPMENVKNLKAKIRRVKDGLRRVANVRVQADSPKWAYIQALLSRGDRRASELLAATHKNRGNWAQTLKTCVVDPDFFVYRQRSFDEILPWDFIDHGVKKTFLIEECQKAFRRETTPPCQVGRCKACGVCA